jgi:hypothetical protein
MRGVLLLGSREDLVDVLLAKAWPLVNTRIQFQGSIAMANLEGRIVLAYGPTVCGGASTGEGT